MSLLYPVVHQTMKGLFSTEPKLNAALCPVPSTLLIKTCCVPSALIEQINRKYSEINLKKIEILKINTKHS